MTLGDIRRAVKDKFPDSDLSKIDRCFISTIDYLNSQIKGNKGIKNAVAYNGTDFTAETGFTYESATQILTLPVDCLEVMAVFVGNYRYEAMSADMFEQHSKDNPYYTVLNREQIKLSSTVASHLITGQYIKIEGSWGISLPNPLTPNGTISTIPKQWEQLIKYGTISEYDPESKASQFAQKMFFQMINNIQDFEDTKQENPKELQQHSYK
jgi:hypothetical protein